MKRSFRSPHTPLLLIILFLVPVAALLLAAGCSKPSSHPSPVAGQATVSAVAEFVGNAACAECHREEFDRHKGSRHATTMRPADQQTLGSLAPPTGPIPQSAYAIREQKGSLRFERIDQPENGATLRFALGAGKDAMTYVGEFTAESLTEFRMTYLPVRHAWAVTPGQEGFSNLNLGLTHEMGMARGCIECHAMKTLPGSPEPDPRLLGVGCESCHGPGSAHIAAARAGNYGELKMENMHGWGGEKINALCGRCHRTLGNVTLDKEDACATGRFQGYGLALSPCFKKSGDRLTCITCHDPHKDVSTDHRAYEKVCLSCHSSNASPRQPVCPVNPKEKCIPCHMPSRPIFADKRIPILMADHLILAQRKKP